MLLRHRQSRSLARLSVEVAQIDREPLEWLQQRWGGGLYSRESRTDNQRSNYRWMLRGPSAAVFLGDIQPFVVRPIVLARIRLAVEYQAQKTATWENRTPEYRQRQEEFVDAMSVLNRRGLVHT